MKKIPFIAIVIAVILSLIGSAGWASDYPSKKIQVIIPYGAGGGTDTLGRIVLSYLEKELGQTIVVMNRPGAKGEIGTAEIQRGAPDGYHLGIVSFPDNTILTGYKKTRYDLDKMVNIASFTADPTSLSVKKDSPFKNLDDFIKYAKENPEKMTVAVSGEAHVYSVLQLEEIAGIKVSTVYHKSGSAAMNAMLGGHVDAAFISLQWCLQAKDQGCPILAVASEERAPNAPDEATFLELGLDVTCVMSRVLQAPEGTPDEALNVLSTALDKIGTNEELKQKVTNTGAIYKYRSGETMRDYFKRTSKKILKIVGENKDSFLRGA